MKLIIPCLASFILTAILTPCVIRVATSCNCMDVPGERRIHTNITPRWGGFAFFAGVLPFLLIENNSSVLTSYIIASIILVIMGMIDDLKPLCWKIKFTVMSAAAAIVIFGGGLTVQNIGSYVFLDRTDFGLLTIPFTFISIIGITNAINLLDGLNGLAAGVSLLGFLFMGIAALIVGNIIVAAICFAFVGALAAFLLFNFPKATVFMGDTGSLFLGFSLAVMALLLTQDKNLPVDALFPVLVLLIPIFDTLRVLVVRLLNGKNPFKADNLHLHYLIVQKNISPAKVTLLFWAITALLGGIALSLISNPSMSYLNMLLLTLALLSMFAFSLSRVRQTHEGQEESQVPLFAKAAAFGIKRHNTAGRRFFNKLHILTIKWIVVLGVLFLDPQAFAGTDCWIEEHPDHYLAVCIGDEKAVPDAPQPSSVAAQPEPARENHDAVKQADRAPPPPLQAGYYVKSAPGLPAAGVGPVLQTQKSKSATVVYNLQQQLSTNKQDDIPSMYRRPRTMLQNTAEQ